MIKTCDEVIVAGGGLAGSEAAWQLAERGVRVLLYEMRPRRMTPAHETNLLAELVCSTVDAAGERKPSYAYADDLPLKEKIIAVIDTGKTRVKVPASLSGVIRGILPENFEVTEGLKMADIDPRVDQVENCSTVSDKARCIGGSVLQLVVAYEKGLL